MQNLNIVMCEKVLGAAQILEVLSWFLLMCCQQICVLEKLKKNK